MKKLKSFSKNKLNLTSVNLIFGGETITTSSSYTVGGNICHTDEHVDKNNDGIVNEGERVYYFQCE